MKKSGQIPAFGNWEYANDLPITQYFECARQAGLFRPTSSSLCHCPPCVAARGTADDSPPRAFADDLYATDFEKPPIRVVSVPTRKTTKVGNGNGNGGGGKKTRKSSDFKEQRKQVKVHDVKEQPRNQLLSGKQFPKQDDGGTTQRPTTAINVKPVDEDLYKIPPKLLHTSKRKKMLGFFSRCLTPPCNA